MTETSARCHRSSPLKSWVAKERVANSMTWWDRHVTRASPIIYGTITSKGHQQRTWTERDHHCSSTLLNHSCIWLQMGFWLAHTHQSRREIGCRYQALDGKLGVWSLVMYCSCPSQFSTVLEPSKVSDEAVFVAFLQLVHCVLGCSFYPL